MKAVCVNVLPQTFEKVKEGKRNFKVLQKQKIFGVGDVLILKEKENGKHTGRKLTVKVIYCAESVEIHEDGYCYLGIKKIWNKK